eukprot:594508-Pelagomonas_calceolata.AAC.1
MLCLYLWCLLQAECVGAKLAALLSTCCSCQARGDQARCPPYLAKREEAQLDAFLSICCSYKCVPLL